MCLHLLFSHSVLSHSFVTPRTVACQAPLSMRFPRQEYWSGLPFSSPGNLPNQGSNSYLLHWQADSLPLSYQRSPSLTLDKALRIPRLNLSINSVPVRIWGGSFKHLALCLALSQDSVNSARAGESAPHSRRTVKRLGLTLLTFGATSMTPVPQCISEVWKVSKAAAAQNQAWTLSSHCPCSLALSRQVHFSGILPQTQSECLRVSLREQSLPEGRFTLVLLLLPSKFYKWLGKAMD